MAPAEDTFQRELRDDIRELRRAIFGYNNTPGLITQVNLLVRQSETFKELMDTFRNLAAEMLDEREEGCLPLRLLEQKVGDMAKERAAEQAEAKEKKKERRDTFGTPEWIRDRLIAGLVSGLALALVLFLLRAFGLSL